MSDTTTAEGGPRVEVGDWRRERYANIGGVQLTVKADDKGKFQALSFRREDDPTAPRLELKIGEALALTRFLTEVTGQG